MDTQKLQPFLEPVKKNPQDYWAWMQLGMAAKAIEDWGTAYCAYLTAVRLQPDNDENFGKFCEARAAYINSQPKQEMGFHFEVFKLPLQNSLLLLIGTLNTDIDPFQNAVKALASKGFKNIILDFSGMQYICGLGPSCLRNLSEAVLKQGGKFVIICQKPEIRNVLALKSITIPEYADIREAFAAL